MNVDGTLTENTGAFATAYEKEAKENNRLHVFVAEVDGEKKYVFPVYGAGLWGAIWGYVALNSDKDTVYGVYSLMPVRLRVWVPKSPARISRESSPARNVGERRGSPRCCEERQGRET